jgi:lipopolysaccharide export system permease protein
MTSTAPVCTPTQLLLPSASSQDTPHLLEYVVRVLMAPRRGIHIRPQHRVLLYEVPQQPFRVVPFHDKESARESLGVPAAPQPPIPPLTSPLSWPTLPGAGAAGTASMKILHRYVLREFLLPFAYCFATFYGLYVLSTLFKSFAKLAAARPSAGFALRYFFDYMAPYVGWLLPAALMLAALYTMWRFCHHNEIVAMRANGLRYATVVAPMLATAAAVALLCALNLEFYAPGAREFARRVEANGYRRPKDDVRRDVHYFNVTARRVWSVDRIDLDNPRVLEGVRIAVDGPDGRRLLSIACRRAEYLDGVWCLFDPQYLTFDPLGNPVRPAPNPLLNLAVRPMPDFNERPRDFVIEKKEWDFLSVRDMLAFLRSHPLPDPPTAADRENRASRLYDIHARLAMPWACVVMTLFAIPAGVAGGRQSAFKGILLAIALFFGFYAASNGCLLLAKRTLLAPALAAWLPNLVFLGAGGVLFARLR